MSVSKSFIVTKSMPKKKFMVLLMYHFQRNIRNVFLFFSSFLSLVDISNFLILFWLIYMSLSYFDLSHDSFKQTFFLYQKDFPSDNNIKEVMLFWSDDSFSIFIFFDDQRFSMNINLMSQGVKSVEVFKFFDCFLLDFH
jgi:hypothetical protein